MAVLSGGIFSKPRGKIGGLVAGSARTRTGKLATLRELVPPSNPNTPAQATQRNKFRSTLDLVRRFGSSIYRNDFNRSVGQLPGFHSMMSIIMGQMNGVLDVSLVNEINLGSLPSLSGLTVSNSDTGEATISFDVSQPSPLLPTDIVVVLAFGSQDANRQGAQEVQVSQSSTIADGSITLSNLSPNGFSEFYVYVRGTDTNDGDYSNAIPFSVDLTP